MDILAVTDDSGAVRLPAVLQAAEAVHRELRSLLPSDYAVKMARVFAGGGRMVAAMGDGKVLGLAVWRVYENTVDGLHLYVDDLVTTSAARSQGVGRALLDWCETKARALGCTALTLDSGTQRVDAHRFYLRERFAITSFHFKKTL